MASIQCSIELYDGVSPRLEEMAVALDGMSGRFLSFADELQGFAPDPNAILAFSLALGQMAEDGERAFDVIDGLIGRMEELFSDVFSLEMFEPLLDGALAVQESFQDIGIVAEEVGARLEETFSLSAGLVVLLFEDMSAQIGGVFDRLGGAISAFAGGIPGRFAGPLAQVVAMFQAMAASAQATLNGVVAAAGRAAAAVSRATSGASVSLPAAAGVRANQSTVSVGAVPSGAALKLPTSGVQATGMSIAPAVNVTVNNQNHLASSMDVHDVVRQIERELSGAVASSVQGVYV